MLTHICQGGEKTRANPAHSKQFDFAFPRGIFASGAGGVNVVAQHGCPCRFGSTPTGKPSPTVIAFAVGLSYTHHILNKSLSSDWGVLTVTNPLPFKLITS